ncbi:hypothetical protein AB670_02744 [Chryseobacterium sp. MOF25P]|uniref:pyocin knob domain-containing protein n=1 Tax=unclassified Chryseobacterium TaxID=2593645 RepID=UPI0008049161|nr:MULTISPECIES: pyocin knob domain-containing protein [unclassified Chryseobacterium]OBW40793.1 hypothetical protein AB670_02744 [Chryseobacterium sp. MOF25P]OBW45257.1 hypothetical protein AB671_02554 [Chryseobacterium sp. BGARF1]
MDVKYSYYISSKGFKITEGTAVQFLKGDGSVDNNSYVTTNTAQNIIAQKTFTQSPVIPDGMLGNHAVNLNQLNKSVTYTGATSDLTLADKNLNFTSGSISKFENGMRIFNNVFQKSNPNVGQNGILSFKFPQASTAATMFTVDINFCDYSNRILGKLRVAFYKSTGTTISTTGRVALWECTDNLPSTVINVGIDISGNVCINLGEINTVWGSYTTFEVIRVQASLSNTAIDWSKGWSQTLETSNPTVPDTYKSLVNIVPEIIATRSWVDNNTIGSIPKNPILLLAQNLDTIITPGFYIQANTSNATIANSYPTTVIGSLKVYQISITTLRIIQEYTDNNLTTFIRRYNGTNWSTWRTILNSIDTIPQLANYIPLSQRAVANGVATLDATVQIPNAQIPQRLTNKVLAIGGEIADTSFTGLYDRNMLALADKEHTVTSILSGSGSFNGGLGFFNSILFNQKPDFARINGADITTELVVTITFASILDNYSRGLWQPFIQTRLSAGSQFRNCAVEVMDINNVWYAPSAYTVQNMSLIPQSGLFLFPESSPGTASIKAVRFKLSNASPESGLIYLSNIGFRHVSHSFAPQFPHRGENNQFYGINTFNASPRVPNATVADQAVNFGQITGKVNQSDLNTQLAGYATLAGVQTFTNTKTFLQSPVVPNPTLLPHAVNLGYVSANFVTTNTAQSITDYKTFEAGAELLLKGDDQNLIQSLKTGNQLGGNIVAGWYYRHYSAIWKAGCIRNSGPLSEGFGFDLSNDGGTTFERIFRIQHDSNLVTRDFGRSDEWYDAYLWGNHAQAGYVKLDDNGNISAKGIIHPDYPNDNNLAFMADGGIRDINDFAGTLVKYIEVQAGAAFTPSTDDTHLDVYARGDMELYLTSANHIQGKKITVYTNNNLSAVVKVYRDGNLVTTIQSGRTTEFILTFTGWTMTDIGSSTFI